MDRAQLFDQIVELCKKYNELALMPCDDVLVVSTHSWDCHCNDCIYHWEAEKRRAEWRKQHPDLDALRNNRIQNWKERHIPKSVAIDHDIFYRFYNKQTNSEGDEVQSVISVEPH